MTTIPNRRSRLRGGLLGVLYGEQALPDRWIATLRGKETVEDWLAKL
ncbi:MULTISPECIES: hypothetical protein [Burkholderia]|nr:MULTISPECIES: hypothetical protein [Burkholderia]